MSEELPLGWASPSLLEVLREPMANGRSVPDGEGFPVLRLTALRGGRVHLLQRKLGAWNADAAAKFVVRKGDFLVARGNGSIALVGRGGLVEDDPDPVAFPDTLIRIRPNEDLLLPQFLRVIWDSLQVRRQIETAAHTSAGIHKVSQQDLAGIRIPLPPIPEQHRIVSKVESLLARVNAARERLEKVPVLMKRFRQAVLAKAFRGELVPTEAELAAREGRSYQSAARALGLTHAAVADDLPEGWAQARLADAGTWCSGGTPSRRVAAYFGGDIPWVKSGDLPDGLLLSTEERITETALENSSAKLVPKSSVSMAMYGATIGKLAVLGIDAATNQACANCRVNEATDPWYLFYYLLFQREKFVSAGQGGAQPNISAGIIKEWPYPVAPLPEQRRIVREIETLLTAAAKVEAEAVLQLRGLERAPQTILQKAFSGELVPTEAELAVAEGRAFESAAELLERVGHSRSASDVGSPRRNARSKRVRAA